MNRLKVLVAPLLLCVVCNAQPVQFSKPSGTFFTYDIGRLKANAFVRHSNSILQNHSASVTKGRAKTIADFIATAKQRLLPGSSSGINSSNDGNVCIGCTVPDQRLTVSGTVKADNSIATEAATVGNMGVLGETSISNFGNNYPVVLSVEQSYSQSTGRGPTFAVGTLLNPASNSDKEHWGMMSQISTSGPVDYSGEMIGIFGEFDHLGTGTSSFHHSGVDGEAFNSSSGNVSGYVAGVQAIVGNYGSGYVTNSYGVRSTILLGGTGDMTNATGVFVAPVWINGGTNTITNLLGLDISDQVLGINNYAIRTDQTAGANNYTMYHAGQAKSYFAGNVGFGITEPTEKVDVDGNVKTTGDVELTDATKGIILKSPNGARWRVTVSDSGTLVTTPL